MTTTSPVEQQPREHAVLCRGVHDLHRRPSTWDPSGYCPDCLSLRAADRDALTPRPAA